MNHKFRFLIRGKRYLPYCSCGWISVDGWVAVADSKLQNYWAAQEPFIKHLVDKEK